MLIDDLRKTILAAMALSVPLNIDVAVMFTPHADRKNLALGLPHIVGLTELRLSLVFTLLLIGYALWLVESRTSSRKPARFFAATTLPALGLVFFSLLSVFQAQDRQLSFFRIAQLVELFLAYFYMANHIRTRRDMLFFVTVSLGGALAESILMIVQWITGLEFIVAGIQAITLGPGRVGGTLTNPGPAATYLSAHAIIACAIMWASSRASRKALAAFAFLLTVLALISTGSRAGWSAFAVTLPLFLLMGLVAGRIKVRGLIMLIMVVLVLGVIFYDVFHTRFTADDRGSAESRPQMWRLGWNMIQAHPWLGVGANNYSLVNGDYYTPDVGNPNLIGGQMHNRYLWIWTESGIFALLCYVGFLGAAIVYALSCIGSGRRWISLLGMGLACSVISLCIQMFTATFVERSITFFVWLLPALTASLWHLNRTYSQAETGSGLQSTLDGNAK